MFSTHSGDEKAMPVRISTICAAGAAGFAPEVAAGLSGSGKIKLSGQTQKFSGDVSGSGDIRAMELMAEESNVQISGSGDVDVYSSVKVSANISGSGDIRYKGGAQVVSSNISGSGGVKKID